MRRIFSESYRVGVHLLIKILVICIIATIGLAMMIGTDWLLSHLRWVP